MKGGTNGDGKRSCVAVALRVKFTLLESIDPDTSIC